MTGKSTFYKCWGHFILSKQNRGSPVYCQRHGANHRGTGWNHKKLNAIIAKLLEQKNKNSNNSSKPPSSDGLAKKPHPRSLKESSGKKVGGQNGHHGASFIVTDHPDHIEKHLPGQCNSCPNREKCVASAKVMTWSCSARRARNKEVDRLFERIYEDVCCKG